MHPSPPLLAILMRRTEAATARRIEIRREGAAAWR
jgi:hypothetical protein